MSSVALATIPLQPRAGYANADAVMEWDKVDGYVIGVAVPTGEDGVSYVLDRQCHKTMPSALRAMAALVEKWDDGRINPSAN